MGYLLKAFKVSFFFITLIGLQSCNPILQRLYGIEPLSSFDEEEYQNTLNEIASKYSGPIISIISQDSLLDQYSRVDTSFESNTTQPIQILYFQGNYLKSFQANCFAKGSLFGNLNWNYDGRFDTFFPTSALPLKDKNLLLSDIKNIYKIGQPTDDITIVFFWTNLMQKKSIEAFELIVDNIASYSLDREPTIIAINTDHFYITPH